MDTVNLSIRRKIFYKKNRCSILKSQAIYNKKVGYKAQKKYITNRRKSDIGYYLITLLRNRLYKIIKGQSTRISAIGNLGCSSVQLKQYLESKFQSGMNWNNYGRNGWHVDHIVPLSSVKPDNIKEIEKLCHFSNLQPLWESENIRKGGKLITEKKLGGT